MTAANRQRLLETLLRDPARSRAELGQTLGLSRATVRTMLAELEGAGLVEQLAGTATAMGRPPRQVSLAPGAAFALGLDIGPRHVRAALCDLVGTVLAERRAEGGLDEAERLAREVLAEADPARVLGAGVGLASPLDATALEARLGMPVRVTSDANAGALGEHLFGAGRGVHELLYVRLSTEVGVGLILGGRPYGGFSGVAGEIGHTAVVEHGPLCRCGNRGCLETVASSAAVTALFGRGVSIEELLELARGGDRGARRVLADAGEAVGAAVAAAVNLLNPELVIIGGELAAAGELLLDPVRRAIERLSVAPARVVTSALGERAEVVGAAALQLVGAPVVLAQRLTA